MLIQMIWPKMLLLSLLLAALAACGSGGPTPTPTATQKLEARAAEAYSFASDRKWQEQTEYISSRSREVCAAPNYAARIRVFADLIIGLEGVSENPTLEFLIRDVTVEGTEGMVSIGYLLDNEPAVVYDEGKRRWVLLEDQWWEEHEAWRDGCVGWKLFQ